MEAPVQVFGLVVVSTLMYFYPYYFGEMIQVNTI